MTLLLPDWNGIDYNDRVICIMADSTGELDEGATDENTYPMLIREKMRAAWGISGTGFLGTWRDEWAFAGSWDQSIANDPWGQGPYILGILTTFRGTQKATASTDIATFTLPDWLRESAISVVLYVVDGVDSADFSYSVDGGSYVNTAGTWVQDDKMKRLNLAVTPATSLAIRGANAAGTARTVYLSAIEIKTSLTGSTLHDVSASSEALINTAENTVANPLADAMGFLDLLEPQALVVSYTNDLEDGFYDLARIESDLAYIAGRQTYGMMLPMSFWGQDRDGEPTDTERQTAMSDLYEAAGADNAFINLYERYGNYATVNALGYMADTAHPSDSGSREIARVLWRILSRGDNPYRPNGVQ